jgi:hypothetical protein
MAMDLCVRRVEGMYVDSSIFQKKRRGNVWIDVPSICKSRIEKNEEEICILYIVGELCMYRRYTYIEYRHGKICTFGTKVCILYRFYMYMHTLTHTTMYGTCTAGLPISVIFTAKCFPHKLCIT